MDGRAWSPRHRGGADRAARQIARRVARHRLRGPRRVTDHAALSGTIPSVRTLAACSFLIALAACSRPEPPPASATPSVPSTVIIVASASAAPISTVSADAATTPSGPLACDPSEWVTHTPDVAWAKRIADA